MVFGSTGGLDIIIFMLGLSVAKVVVGSKSSKIQGSDGRMY